MRCTESGSHARESGEPQRAACRNMQGRCPYARMGALQNHHTSPPSGTAVLFSPRPVCTGNTARSEQIQPRGILPRRQGYRSPNDAERRENGVSLAWLHHKGRNRHHFEYWIDYCIGEDGKVYMGGCKMPLKYVAEMFCDRIAACKIYQGEQYTDASAYDYYERSRGHILIHPETGELIGEMLRVLKEEGEDAAFSYVRGLLREEEQKSTK